MWLIRPWQAHFGPPSPMEILAGAVLFAAVARDSRHRPTTLHRTTTHRHAPHTEVTDRHAGGFRPVVTPLRCTPCARRSLPKPTVEPPQHQQPPTRTLPLDDSLPRRPVPNTDDPTSRSRSRSRTRRRRRGPARNRYVPPGRHRDATPLPEGIDNGAARHRRQRRVVQARRDRRRARGGRRPGRLVGPAGALGQRRRRGGLRAVCDNPLRARGEGGGPGRAGGAGQAGARGGPRRGAVCRAEAEGGRPAVCARRWHGSAGRDCRDRDRGRGGWSGDVKGGGLADGVGHGQVRGEAVQAKGKDARGGGFRDRDGRRAAGRRARGYGNRGTAAHAGRGEELDGVLEQGVEGGRVEGSRGQVLCEFSWPGWIVHAQIR